MSPRKSSTSSGKPPHRRPRYLGIEVAGEHLPFLSPREWEHLLSTRLSGPSGPGGRFRLIRSEGPRAIVEFDHRNVFRARELLDGAAGGPVPLRSTRTWGTLVGAKDWLRARSRDVDK